MDTRATIKESPHLRVLFLPLRTTGCRPLTDHATIIDLIAATTTKRFEAVLDTTARQKRIKITKTGMKHLTSVVTRFIRDRCVTAVAIPPASATVR